MGAALVGAGLPAKFGPAERAPRRQAGRRFARLPGRAAACLRPVLALVDLAGLDYAQSAAVLGLSPAQVLWHLAEARQAVSAALARQ